MAAAVFALCAITSAACAALLWRGWFRSRARLLLWAALSFVGFAVNNLMLFVDEIVVPGNDLQATRDVSGFAAVAVLLVGLVWDRREPVR